MQYHITTLVSAVLILTVAAVKHVTGRYLGIQKPVQTRAQLVVWDLKHSKCWLSFELEQHLFGVKMCR